MKKKMILLMALLASMVGVQAQGNSVSVSAVTIPQGGTGSFDIVLTNSEQLTGYQMTLTLPEGISFDRQVKSDRFVEDDHTVSAAVKTDGMVAMTCLSGNSTAINGNSGTLLTMNISASADLAVGETLTATLTDVIFVTTPEGVQRNLDDVNISITIGAPADTRVLIDEDETAAPAAATGVDVRVKRTITAGVWNTICLPFAMTAAQVKEAFGDDVLLGDFTGCETELDGDENVTGLTVKFNSATAIEANHPYIIKVSANVEEFTADGVTIEAEEEPSVDKDPYVVGKGKTAVTFYNRFVGNYVNGTQVPAETLFLNSDMFWYSTGATTIKSLRGYFDFYDVLSSYDAGTNARMRIAFNETNRMDDVKQAAAVTDGNIYSLQGVQVENPQKGPYIKDGKVVIFKLLLSAKLPHGT